MKRIIRFEYGLHHLNKIWIDLEKETFRIRIGDCDSIDIDLPTQIKRDVRIEKLLRERWKDL